MAKSENSKAVKSGESKSTEASKSNVNGTRPTGASKHEASQGKNVTRVEKETDSTPSAGEQKRHVQNGKFLYWFLGGECSSVATRGGVMCIAGAAILCKCSVAVF